MSGAGPRLRRARRRRAGSAVARGARARARARGAARRAARRGRCSGPAREAVGGAARDVRRRARARRRRTRGSTTSPRPPGARRSAPSWRPGAPAAVVAAGSERGNEVLAHVAARAGLPMAANVVEVDARATRGGSSASAGPAACSRTRRSMRPIRLLTVAPHAVAVDAAVDRRAGADRSPASSPSSSPRTSSPGSSAARPRTSSGVSLLGRQGRRRRRPRRRLGGRASSSWRQLATALGGAVGGSRVVTSLGWRPHSDQIGQTGLRIAPDLYIACGISGAIQHIVGCKAAKRILAINTDPDSPIMAVADYAVIGDLGDDRARDQRRDRAPPRRGLSAGRRGARPRSHASTVGRIRCAERLGDRVVALRRDREHLRLVGARSRARSRASPAAAVRCRTGCGAGRRTAMSSATRSSAATASRRSVTMSFAPPSR